MTPSKLRLREIAAFRPGIFIAAGAVALVLAALFALNTRSLSNANAMPDNRGQEANRPAVATHVEVSQEVGEDALPSATRKRERVQVLQGDNISSLLRKLGVSSADLHQLLEKGERASELRRIFPGQWVEVDKDEDGSLKALKLEKNAATSLQWTRVGYGFELRLVEIEPEVRVSNASATIVNNLFVAGQRVGLGDEIILRIAKIFRWDIDFALEVRAGDSFELVYESEYLDGEFHRYGDILAVRFSNRGRDHTAIRYLDEDGNISFFTPEGESMRGAFLRAPVDFTRVSSGFSYTRLHPLFNRVRAHLGVDYAAPSGTPVKAAGNGWIKEVDRNSSAGNFVTIEHPNDIETRYLHLSRFVRGLKPGAEVQQGDVIGYVGATGWATGPHLHYEYIQSGTHMDPRRVDVQREMSISDEEKNRFLAQTTPLLNQLNDLGSASTLVGAR